MCRWVLKFDPEAGLDMFVQISHFFPPSIALPILTAHSPTAVAPYLEACLHNGTASHQDYDHEVATLHLKAALEAEKEADPGHEEDGDAHSHSRRAIDKVKLLV